MDSPIYLEFPNNTETSTEVILEVSRALILIDVEMSLWRPVSILSCFYLSVCWWDEEGSCVWSAWSSSYTQLRTDTSGLVATHY